MTSRSTWLHLLTATRLRAAVLALAGVVGLLASSLGFLRALDYPLGLLSTPLLALLFGMVGIMEKERDPLLSWVGEMSLLAAAAVALIAVPVGIAGVVVGAVCEPLYGGLFLVLGPLAVAPVAALFGRGLGTVLPRNWALAGWALLVPLSAFVPLVEFLLTPAVRFYATFFGLYHGAVYDEAVFVDAPYLWLRAWNLAAAGVVLALLYGARHGWSRRLLRGGLPGAVLAFLALSLAAPWCGFLRTPGEVDDVLSDSLTVGHVTVRFMPGGRAAPLAPLLADELLVQSRRLQHLYALPEELEQVTAYLYESPRQKAALMGAGRTSIAKPWLRQLHVHSRAWQSNLVSHELAHVLLGAISPSLLAMPTSSLGIPRPGILEGAAVAAERGGNLLTTHQWARAMRAVDKLPDLEVILEGLGFWSQASSNAYTACGSFVRFLLETYGPGPFAELYGGASFEAAYGQPLPELLDRWHHFLDGISWSAEDRTIAEYLFSRPPVFDKVCAYAGGRCYQRAARAAAARDPAVVPLAARALRLTRVNVTLGLKAVRLLMMVGEVEAADALLELVRRRHIDRLHGVAAQAITLARGDIAWLQGDTDAALAAYETLAGTSFATWTAPALDYRLALVPAAASQELTRLVTGALLPVERGPLLADLLGQRSLLPAAGQLRLAAALAPEPDLADGALDILAGLSRESLPQGLVRERALVEMLAAHVARDRTLARQAWQTLASMADTPARREAIRIWGMRLEETAAAQQ